jgi:hypothetical protein
MITEQMIAEEVRAAKEAIDRETFRDFSVGELRTLFDSLACPTIDGTRYERDWKLPITALVDTADVAKVSAAIGFFTGAETKVVYEGTNGKTVVHSDGYYAAMGD